MIPNYKIQPQPTPYPLGSFATIYAPGHRLHGSLGEIVRVQYDAKRADGHVAIHILNGPSSYQTFVVRPANLQPAPAACYHCKHARPMNDRDKCRCSLTDGVVSTSSTCGHFVSRKPNPNAG